LATYVDCRQAFTNLDGVTTELVLRVCLLASKAHRIIKGVHTKKTSSFVKACLAYCHITVPSLDDVFARLRLLLECAEVSLTNQVCHALIVIHVRDNNNIMIMIDIYVYR
jgi:hypothetical protein